MGNRAGKLPAEARRSTACAEYLVAVLALVVAGCNGQPESPAPAPPQAAPAAAPHAGPQDAPPPASTPAGAGSSASLWETFASAHYVDRDAPPRGKNEDIPRIAVGRRSAHSLVSNPKAVLSAAQLSQIHDAVFASAKAGEKIPADALERIAKAQASYEVWQTRSGALLVAFCAKAASPGAQPMTIWDTSTQRHVSVPSSEDRLQGVAWVAGEQTVVLRKAIGVGEDSETVVCPAWTLQDVVDIDEDGRPEIVLVETGYESEELQIESIVDGHAVVRWSGLAWGL